MSPISKYLRKVESRVRQQLGAPAPWVQETLLGRTLVLRDGTLRPQVDYDDAWLHTCAQHCETMFDVGANVGQASLMALLCPSVKRVVLVEANRDALAVAAENLIRNGLSTRAQFVGAFASDASDTEVTFWTVGTGAAGSMYQGHAVTARLTARAQKVPSITLDELAETFEMHPDLVKIDIEGAEAKALRGSMRITARRKTRFLVEMHSPPELPMAENASLVLAWAREVDYAAWYLREGIRITSPEPIAHRGRCHLLLQPADWPYPDWLVGIGQSAPLPA